MSNQTIDGAPRELLELCAQCLDNSGYAAAHGELRALLAKPAEQHQGEPVGYKYRRKSKNRAWTYSANRPEFAEEEFEILPLYTRPAEQPAPVAAVHPFAQKVIRKLQRFQECAEDFESGGVDIGRHWLDLLTQLGLLNRVQRSPALWEITQQGEDCLNPPQQ